jgi:Cof subfamily protein (haloacid dehalogenase superfamily)
MPDSHSTGGIGGAHEPEFSIRLIAIDIDGTLVGDDLVIGERTAAAIKEAVRRGVHVSLATGRMASSAMHFASPLGLVDPIVAFQGGLIRAMPDAHSTSSRRRSHVLGRLLIHRPLPADAARDAITWARANGLHPHANHLERFIVTADDPAVEDYSAFGATPATVVPDLATAIRRPVTKVLAVGDEPRPMELLAAARAHMGNRAAVTISHPQFMEFIAPGVSKGRALSWLARRAGVPLGAALAIGDQLNDLEMVALAGHGAAMASAPDELRSVARYIAPPVAEEGVAVLIEALVLASPRRARANARRMAADAVEANPHRRERLCA